VALVPALCCVPYLAVVTGKPYAAVLFTVVLLAAVKLAGCVVAVLVYGWNAQAEGHLALPWERPNLLVCLCLAGAMVVSVVMYPLGRRAFLAQAMPPPNVFMASHQEGAPRTGTEFLRQKDNSLRA
jgi:hypothetical protein